MAHIKTSEEVALMTRGGKLLGDILMKLLDSAIAGTTLIEIDKKAEQLVKDAGGTPSFMTVEGYTWTTCLCVGDVVVHGVPTEYELKNGDILTIDVGMLWQGFHTDTAWSLEVGHEMHKQANKSDTKCQKTQEFFSVGKTALREALEAARGGNKIGHISTAIQRNIEGAGYSIVRSLVGHGVGRTLHEEPQIPGFVRGEIDDTELLVSGMTIAIEVIYARGKGAISYDEVDGWTIRTRDGSDAAVFEQTVVITDNYPIVLTPVNSNYW